MGQQTTLGQARPAGPPQVAVRARPGMDASLWLHTPALPHTGPGTYLGRVAIEVWNDEARSIFARPAGTGRIAQAAIAALSGAGTLVPANPWADPRACADRPGAHWLGRAVIEAWDQGSSITFAGSAKAVAARAAEHLLGLRFAG